MSCVRRWERSPASATRWRSKLEGHPEPRVGHYLSRIQAGVLKMEQFIEALLSLAQLVRAPLRYETVDLSAIAREILEGLQMQQPERRASVQVQDNLVAQGDARLLRLVLENLLGNAWKFTSHQNAARIEVGRLEDGSAFYVRDNGVGFDMVYAGRLFGTFQRLHTEAEFPGTGIGLATVARVMERHQGTVWAESQPGQGACFFFTLPDSRPAGMAGRHRPVLAAEPVLKPGRNGRRRPRRSAAAARRRTTARAGGRSTRPSRRWSGAGRACA